MENAFDLSAREYKNASDPQIYKHKCYICARCGAPVYLSKGPIRAHHFSHQKGWGNQECDEYNPVYAKESFSKRKLSKTFPYRQLNIYLKLDTNTKEDRFPWSLDLSIPEPDGEYDGYLVIPFASNGEVQIPVNRIKQGGLREKIQPFEAERKLIYYGNSEGRWEKEVREPVSGLFARGITVFRSSPHGGRRLKEGQPLYWGREYVLVFKDTSEPKWWPIKSKIKGELLSKKEGWGGCLIRLPSVERKEVKNWVSQWLGREIQRPHAKCYLVSPTPHRKLDDGSLVISATSQVIIGVSGEAGSVDWGHISISSSEAPMSSRLMQQVGEIPSLYSIGNLNSGRYDIWMDDDLDNVLQIVSESTTERIPLPPGVEFHIKNNDGKVMSISLFDDKLKEIFNKVRSLEFEIVGVRLPYDLPVSLSWLDFESRTWLKKKFKKTADSHAEEELFAPLKGFLSRSDSAFLIDAKEYGRIKISPDEGNSKKIITMTSEWRRRARWLLSFTNARANIGKVNARQRLKFPIDTLHPDDREIVGKLHSHQNWLPMYLPHVRALLNELESRVGKIHNTKQTV